MFENPRLDPADAAQFYIDEQDRLRTWELKNNTCADCHHCELPNKDYYDDETVGWCLLDGEFIHTDDIPWSKACESWIPR